MSEEMFQGLVVDLTTVLEKRNKDCALATKIIAGLVTALILGERGSEERKKELITEGRRWLADYNTRVHPPKGKSEDSHV